jgi:SAM-dependent methyltransferase
MRMFLRKPVREREPLAVTMSGARMGERMLQIGIDDPALTGALAAKTGLSGHAAIAVTTEPDVDRATRAAANASALADVHLTALDRLPFESASFDVVVVHNVKGVLGSLDTNALSGAMTECRRVLRQGGRALVIEGDSKGRLGGFLRPRSATHPPDEHVDRTLAALKAGGFSAVRLLAEREGLRFSEGLKG